MAADSKLSGNGPSLKYHLADVSVELTHITDKLKRIATKIKLVSTDEAVINAGEQEDFRIVAVGDKEFIGLIKSLYQINFFFMPEIYNRRYSVVLNEDRSISTSALHLKDRVSSTICFLEKEYRKCVTFDEQSSKELNDIADVIKRLSRKK